MKKLNVILTTIFLAVVALIIVGAGIFVSLDSDTTSTNNAETLRDMSESDIAASEDKVNVYIFWGDGCPHCKDLGDYLNSHAEDFQPYANIYSFEVWKNSTNATFMKDFAKYLGEEAAGVPFIVVGSQVIPGYGDDSDGAALAELVQTLHASIGQPVDGSSDNAAAYVDPYLGYTAQKTSAE